MPPETPEDARLLQQAMALEEQCMLRFLEMSEAFRPFDVRSADRFLNLSREEQGHRDRLTAAWMRRGAPAVPATEILDWLCRSYPNVMELWDRDDSNLQAAGDRVLGLESCCVEFHRWASRQARDPQVSRLFVQLADEETAHAG